MSTVKLQSLAGILIDGRRYDFAEALAKFPELAGDFTEALRAFFRELMTTRNEAQARAIAAEKKVADLLAAQAELIARGKAAAESLAGKLTAETSAHLRAEIAALADVISDGQKPVEVRRAEEALDDLAAQKAAKEKEMKEIDNAIAEAQAVIEDPAATPSIEAAVAEAAEEK